MPILTSKGVSDSEFIWLEINCISANGYTIGPGINLWVYDPLNPLYREDAFPFSFTNYSTTQYQLFANNITSLYPGTRVAVLVYNGLPNPIPDYLARAFTQLGSTNIYKVQSSPNYVIFGQRGGTAIESFGNNATAPGTITVQRDFTFEAVPTTRAFKFLYDVAGTLFVYNFNALGSYTLKAINILTYIDKKINQMYSFSYDDLKAPDALYAILSKLPYGTKFAMFTNGFYRFPFTTNIINFIKSCGSKYIDTFTNSNSQYNWYMVSKVGSSQCYCEYSTAGACGGSYNLVEDTMPMLQEGSNEVIESDISIFSDVQKGEYIIWVNGSRLYAENSLGFIMSAINEVTGQVYYTRNYDISVCNPDESKRMINDILNLSIGTVVVVALAQPNIAFDYGYTDELKFALGTIGAASSYDITSNTSYTLIGRKGSYTGSVFEDIGQRPSNIYSNFVPRVVKSFIEIEASSNAVYTDASEPGYTSFKINGVYVPQYQENNQVGLNVMTINPTNGTIQELLNYDTQTSDVGAIEFSNKLKSLPNGTIVAVSAVGAASQYLETADQYITEYLGSSMISSYSYPNSYCLISALGDNTPLNQRIVSECLSNGSNILTTCSMRFPLKSLFKNQTGINFCVTSKGHSNGQCKIMINGKMEASNSGTYSPGINVIYATPDLVSITYKLYNTTPSWSQFLTDVQALKDGTFVLVAINQSMPVCTTNEKKRVFSLIGACKFIMVPDNGSYSCIGIKGITPGSAYESYSDGSSQVCVASWEPVPDSSMLRENTFLMPPSNQTIFSVPLLDNYYSICTPDSLLDKNYAIGNIYINEPATNLAVSRSINFSGRVVKALLIGLQYKSSASNPLDNAIFSINDHANALVNCGYVLKDNVHILSESLTQISNDGSYVCGPSATCIKDQINNWMMKNLQEGDSLYVAVIGRGFNMSSFGGSDVSTGLITLDNTLQYSDYSLKWTDFQTLFNSAPPGVNITFVLDCNNTQNFITSLVGRSYYNNCVVYLASQTSDIIPVTSQTIGFLPLMTRIILENNTPTMNCSTIFTKMKTSTDYKSVPQMWISGNSSGDFPFLTRPIATSLVPIYQYHASVPGSTKLRYFYSSISNVGGEWVLDGAVWKALPSDSGDGVPIYQYSILTRPVINGQESYNYDYSISSSHSRDPLTGYEWYSIGSVWRAYKSSDSGKIPVYRYYFDQVTRRYLYSTSSNYGNGWTKDTIAFYVAPL